VAPSGTLTALHVWSGPEGYSPTGALIQAQDGNLYGTTFDGGANTNGNVFKMTLSGAVTSLHIFNNTNGDGAYPYAGLVQGTDGDFYETTPYGGLNNDGTIFVISSSGAFTTLHSFDITHGSIPYGALVQTANGDLYATTFSGGSTGCGGMAAAHLSGWTCG
jgi:uncharacterized repeat protein (TIGR03803 family)